MCWGSRSGCQTWPHFSQRQYDEDGRFALVVISVDRQYGQRGGSVDTVISVIRIDHAPSGLVGRNGSGERCGRPGDNCG